MFEKVKIWLFILCLCYTTCIAESINKSGTITGTITFPISVHADGLNVGLMHNTKNLVLVLQDPNGLLIRSDIRNHLDDVTVVNNVVSDGMLVSGIQVTNPIVGQWVIILEPEPGTTPAYMLSANTIGDRIALALEVDPLVQMKGKKVTLIGHALNTKMATLNSLVAAIQLPDQTKRDLILKPTKSTFSADFTETSLPGLYTIELRAEKSSSEAAYGSFSIGDPNNLHFTGKISEFLNHEDFYNSLNFQFSLLCTNAGIYHMCGELRDVGNNTYEATATALLQPAAQYGHFAGVTNMVLAFATPEIVAHQAEGALTLTRLEIYRDVPSGSELQMVLTNVVTTTSFRLGQFEPRDFNLLHQLKPMEYRPRNAHEDWPQWFFDVVYPMHIQNMLKEGSYFLEFSRLQGEGSFVFGYIVHVDGKYFLIGSSDDDSTLFSDVVLRIKGMQTQTEEIHPTGLLHSVKYNKVSLTTFDIPPDATHLSIAFPALGCSAPIKVLEEEDFNQLLNSYFKLWVKKPQEQ